MCDSGIKRSTRPRARGRACGWGAAGPACRRHLQQQRRIAMDILTGGEGGAVWYGNSCVASACEYAWTYACMQECLHVRATYFGSLGCRRYPYPTQQRKVSGCERAVNEWCSPGMELDADAGDEKKKRRTNGRLGSLRIAMALDCERVFEVGHLSPHENPIDR